MLRLEGKVTVITGAGSGIGRETAQRFAREGAKVVVAEIDVGAGQQTVDTILSAGGEATLVETDVTDPDSVARMVTVTLGAYERLDVLHNNAGGSTTRDGPVTEVPIDEWWRTINIDLFGTFLGCRYAIPAMIERGGGSIINMASIVALVGVPGRDAYSAAKGGIAALTRSMAKNFAPHNVRVNAIAPGGVATARIRAMMGIDAERWLSPTSGVPRMAEPADIADLAVYLASDEARMVTGVIVPVDGGMSSTIDFG